MVVMSNSKDFVEQLISVGGELGVTALTAETQRRSFDGNVTWFRFVAKDEEDGRLRPKLRSQAASEGLSVCHVWQAETVILQSGPTGQLQRCLIRLPRPPDPDRHQDSTNEGRGGVVVGVEPVFAAMFRFTNIRQWKEWKKQHQQYRQLSAPARGSESSKEDPTAPPSTARLHLAVRQIGASETQAVYIREVLRDAHQFCELAGPSANTATEGASAAAAAPSPIIVLEYCCSSGAGSELPTGL